MISCERTLERCTTVLIVIATASCSGKPERLTSGAHSGLACAACHSEGAAGEVAGFATSAACEGCHPAAALSAEVELASVRFPHSRHGTLTPALSTPCSACHTHDSGKEDLRADASACFLCHATLPAGESAAQQAALPEASCLGCHGQPTHTAFASTGTPIDHATVVERGISCQQCHYRLIEGTGAASQRACRECHGIAPGAPRFREGDHVDAASAHLAHYGKGETPRCARCHEPVDHHVGAIAGSLALNCAGCHGPDDPARSAPVDSAAHGGTQLLYAGLVAGHPEAGPSPKFLARIDCEACHSVARGGGAIEARCISCHGESYSGIREGWMRGMGERTASVGAYVRTAVAQARISALAPADSLARTAHESWKFVESANGVHNVRAAHALLRGAVHDAAAAYRRAGLEPPPEPRLGPDPGEQSCARCHYGIENARVSFQGETFDHRAHVVHESLACVECHASADLFAQDGRTLDPAHGSTIVSAPDCRSCHHGASAGSSCESCHGRDELDRPRAVSVTVHVEGAPRRTHAQTWTHERHTGIACDACHDVNASPSTRPDAAVCSACHADHHAEARECASCHVVSAAAAHARDTHGACDECHASDTVRRLVPDDGFCRVCHREVSAHYESTGLACSTCHFLATPTEYRRHLVGTEGKP